jgi:chromate transporter
MTLFAAFYRTPIVRSLTTPMLINHFGMVLAALIGVTWLKQLRTLARTPLEQLIAALSTILLAFAHSPAAFVGILFAAFAAGWLSGPPQHAAVDFTLSARDRNLLVLLAVLVAVFAVPLPGDYQATLLWPRLAGAGMTLFGGGFSALPVLKTLFVSPATGISDHDFTLAFALSPVSPGPLLNVVPFLGYLTDGWLGALLATTALFVPSGCLVVFAQNHLSRLKRHSRFEHGMRLPCGDHRLSRRRRRQDPASRAGRSRLLAHRRVRDVVLRALQGARVCGVRGGRDRVRRVVVGRRALTY